MEDTICQGQLVNVYYCQVVQDGPVSAVENTRFSHDGWTRPEAYRAELLDEYCNYVIVDEDRPAELENTFILSSWAPHLRDRAPAGTLLRVLVGAWQEGATCD